jgi:hypothetical protein
MGLTGAIGMIVSFVVDAVIFFTVLCLLGKYAHIVFFGFDQNEGKPMFSEKMFRRPFF